ncbi:MAG: cytochrome P450 [Rhodobacteraceae bacterium]|nr:cytochrome P450 [Paracoccaceae bacterium]
MKLPDLRDPDFVQNPFPTYAAARTAGPVLWWDAMNMHAAFDHATVNALLRDKRFGREIPSELAQPVPDHLQAFDAVERHSMLDLEPPRHTRLRGLVLRAFTGRRIGALQPDLNEICDDLLAGMKGTDTLDLIPEYCQLVPVRVIARLLGVPEDMGPDLLRWSTAMVAMYQASRDRKTEDAANTAAQEFADFLRGYVEERRKDPRDDLITELIAAEEDGEKLTADELIGTCVLLLNAGHEATVHSMGNAVACLLENQTTPEALSDTRIEATVEEVLRFKPPLHVFTRYAYEDTTLGAVSLKRGDQVALVLSAAGRDPAVWDMPDTFRPERPVKPHVAFGGGLHFCVGAKLARMELQVGLQKLFTAFPDLSLAGMPHHADSYHFHKFDALQVNLR